MFFDEYLGIRHKKCIVCASIVSILRLFTSITIRALKVSEESLSKVLRVPYWRKGLAATIKGLAWFGSSRPFTTGAPLFIVWNFTNRCNLRCRHCYQNAGINSSKELTTYEGLKLVEELAEADVSSIAFSGGEPLCRKDFFKIAKRARELGMYVAVATNGTLIDREVARKLSEIIHYAEISLDGINPATHDRFRGVAGSWEKAVSAIKYLVEEGVSVGVATTATKHNLNEIPKIVKFAEELGADYFICFNFVPTGRGVEMIKYDLSPREREELLKFLYRRLVNNMLHHKKTIICSTAPQFSRVGLEMRESMAIKSGVEPVVPATHYASLPGITPEVAEFIGGCGAGRVYAAISPEGDVQPCVFMPIKLGNIRERRFEDIWLNSKVLNDLRDREKLKGECGVCSYKYVCGGCRARAYGYFGDYLMPDPGCIRQLREKPEKVESLLKHITGR